MAGPKARAARRQAFYSGPPKVLEVPAADRSDMTLEAFDRLVAKSRSRNAAVSVRACSKILDLAFGEAGGEH